MKISVLLLLFGSTMATAEVAVIVHPSKSSALTADAAARLFLGKAKALSDGTVVLPVSQAADAAVTEEFNAKVLGKSASQLKAYWSQLVFTGKGTPPRESGGDAEVIKLVANNPNIVGYINAAAADNSVAVVGKF